ncbi:MAG: ribosome silencing factor [Eubacteriales bacterium]|nr:ribosome silencing factor [Eubacteriales bacterium]MCI7095341.1 ribosome silencing factor [Clostridiales bacterium]
MELTARQKVDLICKALAEKKAFDIKVIEVASLTDVADYFIVCSGKSIPQVRAIFDNLEEKAEAAELFCRHKEGYRECRWIAVDYDNVIVHIFHQTSREFYQLDKLWNNGNNVIDYSE